MSLLDLCVIALMLVVGRYVPVIGGWEMPLAITVALIIERLLKGERI
jgi:hypothetical protein